MLDKNRGMNPVPPEYEVEASPTPSPVQSLPFSHLIPDKYIIIFVQTH
jgi:hypothetical protein